MSPKAMFNNQEVETEIITIIESVERYGQIRLQDGTILNIKATPTEVALVKNQTDQEGKPVYLVKSNTIIAIHSTPHKTDI